MHIADIIESKTIKCCLNTHSVNNSDSLIKRVSHARIRSNSFMQKNNILSMIYRSSYHRFLVRKYGSNPAG